MFERFRKSPEERREASRERLLKKAAQIMTEARLWEAGLGPKPGMYVASADGHRYAAKPFKVIGGKNVLLEDIEAVQGGKADVAADLEALNRELFGKPDVSSRADPQLPQPEI